MHFFDTVLRTKVLAINVQAFWCSKDSWDHHFLNKVYRALDRWTSVVHVARKSLLAILCLILKVQLTHGRTEGAPRLNSLSDVFSFLSNILLQNKNPPDRRCFPWSGSMLCVPCYFIYVSYPFSYNDIIHPSSNVMHSFAATIDNLVIGALLQFANCISYYFIYIIFHIIPCISYFISIFHIYHISYNTMYIISIFHYIIFHIHFPKRHYIHPFLMFESNLFIRRTLLRNQRGRALIWSDMNIFDPSFQLKPTQPPCLKF